MHQSETELAPDATKQTLRYYASNAEGFATSTADVEFSAVQERFAALLRHGASILDFGCGSGRDAKRFLDLGFNVTATDGSPELCEIARQRTELPVRLELFQDLAEIQAYDGIWACASILHLPKDELGAVLDKMAIALKPGGIIYTSFKHGEGEGMHGGRYFTDFTEPTFRTFLCQHPTLAIQECWITSDARPNRHDEKWLNLLLRKHA